MRTSSLRAPALFLFVIQIICTPVSSAQEENGYTNLQVLDPDISRDELGLVMVGNTVGLGLPRRQREGCLFCHVGDMDQPVELWDFASDEKATKLKARAMMAMVNDINGNHLSALDERLDASFEVSCITCHRGRTDPRPLPDVLMAAYSNEGISAATGKYRELRERYFGAGAYDFRTMVLVRLANNLATRQKWDDALAFARLNEDANPDDTFAATSRFTIQVQREIDERGVSQALAWFDRNRNKEMAGVVDYRSLDFAGWTLYRQDRIDDALQLFRRNVELFADEYITNESLGDALWFSGDKQGGIEIFESWVERNPENDMGRRRLLNMREEI